MNKYKKIVVLGAGESGVGTAILAQKQGLDVFVSDYGQIKPNYLNILTQKKIPFEQQTHKEINDIIDSTTDFSNMEVVKSPGIPDNSAIITKLKQKGVPIISEIEFAGRYTKAKMICITGSNGKTTTTMLTYKILKDAMFNVGLAGNIGKSFALQVAEESHDYYVLEISSFQLDGMYDFKADIAVISNITPDHLDRYDYNFQNYINSKFRIVQNQTKDDHFIFFSDDSIIQKEIAKRTIISHTEPFALTKEVRGDSFNIINKAYTSDNTLILENINCDKFLEMDIDKISIKGVHNVYNSMAASLVGQICGVSKESIRNSLETFEGVEHRMEYVSTIRGVEYINDSKATNINSCWYALQSMKRPVILILGGQDKGNDYSELSDLIIEKVTALIFLGVDNKKLVDFFSLYKGKDGKKIPYFEAKSMSECIQKAYRIAKDGDVVLLSPACASFDLFKNYEDRGCQFKEAVLKL